MRKAYYFVLILLLLLFALGCLDNSGMTKGEPMPSYINSQEISEEGFIHMNTETAVVDVINHPAFVGFGQFLFPTEHGSPNKEMRLNEIASLMPYHNNINSATTVNVINYMLDEVKGRETIFYDYYTEGQKQDDPDKENTGLFFFPGKPNAPFAIICPGGGFSYVGSIHEGFPHALELSKKGYNALVIQYRVGGADVACEDLAAAISYIFKNAEALRVDTKDYSVWGSSGAKLAKENQVDVILGVGGGSVMDCCKAVSMAAVCQEDVWKNFWARSGVVDFEPLPLGVIVTVSGTGSEMNGGAVITNEEVKVKTGRDYPKCNPKFAIMNPEYTFTVPPKQTASGGFDILSHIMETYFSDPNEDNVSDDISEALMRSVIRNLPIALENPSDYTARSNLMWASNMAENRIIKLGKKADFQAHQIEHQLGAYTDCNHGCGLAVISPAYYRHIYSFGLKKFARFAKDVWGISYDGKTEEQLAAEGVEALAQFIREIGL